MDHLQGLLGSSEYPWHTFALEDFVAQLFAMAFASEHDMICSFRVIKFASLESCTFLTVFALEFTPPGFCPSNWMLEVEIGVIQYANNVLHSLSW